MDNVYIETSIVSHATAWPSSNSATAVLQGQAKCWIDEQAANSELVTSQIVLTEANRSDAESRRLAMLADIPVLNENAGRQTCIAFADPRNCKIGRVARGNSGTRWCTILVDAELPPHRERSCVTSRLSVA